MKNIWRIALLGYLYGMFALIMCVIAIVTGIVEDMGIAVLVLPILCPILLILFRHFSNCAWEEKLYGEGAFMRWINMGAMAGGFYMIKKFLEDQVAYAGLIGLFLVLVYLLAFWLMFFYKGRKF
jgi:hypothetical protein